MTDREELEVVDLGVASEVTRGQAIVQQDVSSGELRFIPGGIDN